MGDYKGIGQQFTQYYYNILDTDRAKLSTLYVSDLPPPFPSDYIHSLPRSPAPVAPSRKL